MPEVQVPAVACQVLLNKSANWIFPHYQLYLLKPFLIEVIIYIMEGKLKGWFASHGSLHFI